MTLDAGTAGHALAGGRSATPYELPSIALRRSRSRGRSDSAADASAAAFSEFYALEFGRLAGYCQALVGSESAARDIAQEALVRVFSRWVSVTQPKAYAYLVATNLAKRTWKRGSLERKAYERAGLAAADDTGSGNDPAESHGAWLRDLVEGLPDRHRLPVLLHYYADLPVAEIGRLLHLPSGTVKRRLHEARSALARTVGERP